MSGIRIGHDKSVGCRQRRTNHSFRVPCGLLSGREEKCYRKFQYASITPERGTSALPSIIIHSSIPLHPIHMAIRTQPDESLLRRDCYDTFAFRDRVTNHTFQCREARQSPINTTVPTFLPDETEYAVTDSLKVYRFAKSFEKRCLRSKYLPERPRKLPQQEDATRKVLRSGRRAVSRETLFQINRQEMRRVLESNGTVNPSILQLNRDRGVLAFRGALGKKTGSKWHTGTITTAARDETGPGEAQRRMTEKIINHMKSEMRSNCQYLLNLPTHKKKQALFNSQLTKHSRKRIPFPKFDHKDLEQCQFTQLILPLSLTASLPQGKTPIMEGEEESIVELVGRGFLSEVLLLLTTQPSLSGEQDDRGNNVLHIAAKTGNMEMLQVLLKTIPPRLCLGLLSQRNRLKRTALDKAKMHGNMEAVRMLEEYVRENSRYLV